MSRRNLNNRNLNNRIYTSYSFDTDITTIFEDTLDCDGNLLRVEVRGFYFGEPSEKNTQQYYGKMKADY